MKKSLVAVSVIVVLGAAWTGASWYTGKLMEQRMSEIVDNANSQIKRLAPQAGLKLAYTDYHRGTFSSKVRYILQPDGTITGENAVMKPGEEIAFIETIDHGPFPMAQLKKFNLIPSMASVHSELENTAAVKALFDITKGKSPFTADSRIGYNGSTDSAIKLIPITYEKDGLNLNFSGASLDAAFSKDMRDVKLNGESDSIVLFKKNEMDQVETFTVKGLSLKNDSKTGKFDLSIGDQNLSIKQVLLSVEGKEALVLDGFTLTSQMGESDKNLNGKLSYTLDSLKIQGNDFGSGKLNFTFAGLDGEAVKNFATSYNQIAMQGLQTGNIDPETYQLQMTELVLTKLPSLLKGDPSFSISPLSWKNGKGESALKLDVVLADPSKVTTPITSQEEILTRAIKKIDANLTIPMPMATEFTTQAARLQGYSAEEAAKMAVQQVQGVAAMGQMFKLTTTKDDVISSSFSFADNKIDLNGQKMTLQEFAGLFGMFGGMPQEEEAPAAEAPAAE
ncbi:YdgA family protein [Yersinia sp. J1]|nr:YdgA family protein [Yersinia entomophaga]